jgi:hypothetical protein
MPVHQIHASSKPRQEQGWYHFLPFISFRDSAHLLSVDIIFCIGISNTERRIQQHEALTRNHPDSMSMPHAGFDAADTISKRLGRRPMQHIPFATTGRQRHVFQRSRDGTALGRASLRIRLWTLVSCVDFHRRVLVVVQYPGTLLYGGTTSTRHLLTGYVLERMVSNLEHSTGLSSQ